MAGCSDCIYIVTKARGDSQGVDSQCAQETKASERVTPRTTPRGAGLAWLLREVSFEPPHPPTSAQLVTETVTASHCLRDGASMLLLLGFSSRKPGPGSDFHLVHKELF